MPALQGAPGQEGGLCLQFFGSYNTWTGLEPFGVCVTELASDDFSRGVCLHLEVRENFTFHKTRLDTVGAWNISRISRPDTFMGFTVASPDEMGNHSFCAAENTVIEVVRPLGLFQKI